MSEAAAVFSLMANHVWQSALLAGLLAALLAGRSQLSAQTRHTLAFAALAGAALLPLAMLLPGNETLMRLFSTSAGRVAPSEVVSAEAPSIPVVVLPPAAPTVVEPAARTARFDYAPGKGWRAYAARAASGGGDAGAAAGSTERTAPIEPTPFSAVAALPLTTSDAVATDGAAVAAAPQWSFDLHRRPAVLWSMVALWLVVAAALLARVAIDALAAERLRRRATPIVLPRPLAHLVGDVDVRESVQAPGPMAAGLVQSSIILPPGFIAQHSPQELLGLLEHERAHVTRGDLPLALMQRILTAIFWWSPAMHWISARVEEEREMACDEAAAHRVGDARAFAKTLTEHAQAQLFWGWPRLVVGAARRRSQLGRRVRRLLDLAGSRARPIELTARASMAVLLAAVAATALATPRLAAQDFDDEDDRQSRSERQARPARPAAPAAPEAPAAPSAYWEAITDAQVEFEDAQEEARRAQDRLNDAVNDLANARGADHEAMQEVVQEATQEYAEAQAELAEAAQEMQQAFVTVNFGPGRNGRGAGVSVDVRGPTPEEAAQIGQSVGALAQAFGSHMDDFDFDFTVDGEAFAELSKNAWGVPGVSFSASWGGAHGDSPLLTAVRSGDLEMVEVLVDAGADINGPDDCGCALVTAIRSGSSEIVSYLLEKGADPNVGVQGDGSPLMIAVRMGDADMVRQLAEAGADVNADVGHQGTPLMTAVRMGDVEMVRALIENGADVEGAAAEEAENGESDGRF